MTKDNIIPFPTKDTKDEADVITALELLVQDNTLEDLSVTISGVLEFLTLRALHGGPYFIRTEDSRAIAVFATDEDAMKILEILPSNVKSWEDTDEVPPFDTNTDPGDEQVDSSEAE